MPEFYLHLRINPVLEASELINEKCTKDTEFYMELWDAPNHFWHEIMYLVQ